MLDLPVYKDAILKLQYAASNLKKTQQKFFLNVGIKRPCDSKPNALLWLRVSASARWLRHRHLVWRVPVGIISEHYHPDTFTPHMPQNRVLDPSIHPVAWVPFFNQNPYTPESVNQTLTLRRYALLSSSATRQSGPSS